jgi:hypothetical protein
MTEHNFTNAFKEDDLLWMLTSKWKITSNGRQPPTEEGLHKKITPIGKRLPSEDNLKLKRSQSKSGVRPCSAQLVIPIFTQYVKKEHFIQEG